MIKVFKNTFLTTLESGQPQLLYSHFYLYANLARRMGQSKPKVVVQAKESRSRPLFEKAEQKIQVRTMAARTQFRMEIVNRQTLRPSITMKKV